MAWHGMVWPGAAAEGLLLIRGKVIIELGAPRRGGRRGGRQGRHSFTTHQHVQRKLKNVKVNTSHTLHSLHSYARDMQRVPRTQTRFRVAIPRVNPMVNPGSEPVQP